MFGATSYMVETKGVKLLGGAPWLDMEKGGATELRRQTLWRRS
jgi:hypothetical protein